MNDQLRQLLAAVAALQVQDMRGNPRVEAVWTAYRDLPNEAPEGWSHAEPGDCPPAGASYGWGDHDHPAFLLARMVEGDGPRLRDVLQQMQLHDGAEFVSRPEIKAADMLVREGFAVQLIDAAEVITYKPTRKGQLALGMEV